MKRIAFYAINISTFIILLLILRVLSLHKYPFQSISTQVGKHALICGLGLLILYWIFRLKWKKISIPVLVILLLSTLLWATKSPPNQFDLALSSLFSKNQNGYLVKRVTYRENDFKYVAYIFAPTRKGPHPGIVFCHGNLPTGKDTILYLEICKQLAKRGYVILDFDIKGFGESERITKVRLPDDLDFVGDAMAAIEYFCKLDIIFPDKISIIGHSSGANIAFAAGVLDGRINNIVCVSPGDFNPRKNPHGLKVHYRNRLAKGLEYEMSMDFYDTLITPITMENYIPDIGPKSVMIIIAEHDHINQKRFAQNTYERMQTPSKEFVEIKGAIHTLGARLVDGHKIEDISKIIDFVDILDSWYKEIYAPHPYPLPWGRG